MPEIQYPTNPNTDTAFVVQDGGRKNRALMIAPQDISTLELPSNSNSCKGYVTVAGKKQRVILTADISGNGGDQHNLGWYADLTALQTAHPTGEDGDFAILGSTDTVWVWDSDTSAWKDTDTKGQVTSVNGQTGAVTLTIPDAVQYSTMPTASADNLGDIVQFTGTTDATYTNGYFYKCVSDGQEPATYSWTQVSVQPTPSGLPDQTGNAGKFLTTDGTDASWSDKPLVNSGTGSQSIGILSTASGTFSVAVGKNAMANKDNACAVGALSSATGITSLALGYGATATKQNAIQIGNGSNSVADTVKIRSYEIMSADGTVPTARLTKVNTTATLAAADWSSSTQTVTVSGVKADSVVFVSPDPASASDYASAGILCTAQAADSLTFTCTQTPSNAITVNVICL